MRELRAVEPLKRWTKIVENAAWSHPAELRQKFGSIDFVKGSTVFDIGGNKFRLVVTIDYQRQLVFIEHILTHTEYDKGAWKK